MELCLLRSGKRTYPVYTYYRNKLQVNKPYSEKYSNYLRANTSAGFRKSADEFSSIKQNVRTLSPKMESDANSSKYIPKTGQLKLAPNSRLTVGRTSLKVTKQTELVKQKNELSKLAKPDSS